MIWFDLIDLFLFDFLFLFMFTNISQTKYCKCYTFKKNIMSNKVTKASKKKSFGCPRPPACHFRAALSFLFFFFCNCFYSIFFFFFFFLGGGSNLKRQTYHFMHFAMIKIRPVASLVFQVRNSVFIKVAIFIFLWQNAVHSNQVLSIL